MNMFKEYNKINKIRTNLLIIADQEFRTHMRKSTFLINSCTCDEILKMFEQNYTIQFKEEISAGIVKSKKSKNKAALNDSNFKIDDHIMGEKDPLKRKNGLTKMHKISVAKKKLDCNFERIIKNMDTEEIDGFQLDNDKPLAIQNNKPSPQLMKVTTQSSSTAVRTPIIRKSAKNQAKADLGKDKDTEIYFKDSLIFCSEKKKLKERINQSLTKIHAWCFGENTIGDNEKKEYKDEILEILGCKGVEFSHSDSDNSSDAKHVTSKEEKEQDLSTSNKIVKNDKIELETKVKKEANNVGEELFSRKKNKSKTLISNKDAKLNFESKLTFEFDEDFNLRDNTLLRIIDNSTSNIEIIF